MRMIAAAIAATSLIASALGAARPDPDAQLAKLVAGRVAGKPVNCIQLPLTQESRTFAHRTIAYRNGSTWYVAKFIGGDCDSLDDFSFLVTTTPTGSLCHGDTAEVHDSTSRIFRGICSFDSFVPYTKPRT